MKPLELYYSEVCSYSQEVDSMSPSPGKPKLVVDALAERVNSNGWNDPDCPPFTIKPVVKPATLDQLRLAHHLRYVTAVLDGLESNGFGNYIQDLTNTQLWTVAAMVEASRAAYFDKSITCAPVSGFHHARFDEGGGFCTFNGLVIAALLSGAEKVGIIDCDYHGGDGTQSIIDAMGYKDQLMHWSAGLEGYKDPRQAVPFLHELPRVVQRMAEAGCDLILYQAGADQHIDDPLGGFLTTEQLKIRDKLVLTWAYNICKLPVCFNFAGGYQDPVEHVVDLHLQTLDVAAQCLNDIQGEVTLRLKIPIYKCSAVWYNGPTPTLLRRTR